MRKILGGLFNLIYSHAFQVCLTKAYFLRSEQSILNTLKRNRFMYKIWYAFWALSLSGSIVACGTYDDNYESRTAAEILLGDEAGTLAEDATLYWVHNPQHNGSPVLTVGVTIDQERYLGLGVELSEQDRGTASVRAVAGVFIEQHGQLTEGACDVDVWRSGRRVRMQLRNCTIGDGTRVAMEFEHTGEIAAIGLADVATSLPHFAPYAQRVADLAVTSFADFPLDQIDDGVSIECSCQPSCDAYLNSCLLTAFSCGGFYALCAAVCWAQHGDCLRGCGC